MQRDNKSMETKSTLVNLPSTIRKPFHKWQSYFKILLSFRDYLRPHLRPLMIGILCALGSTVVSLAEPWPLKFIFDNVLLDRPISGIILLLIGPFGHSKIALLGVLIGAIIVLAMLSGFFYYGLNVYLSNVGQEVTSDIRADAYTHLQQLSLRFHDQSHTGDLLMRLTHDIAMLRQLLVSVLISAASESIVMFSMILILFLMNWQLTLVTILIVPMLFFLTNSYRKKIKEAVDKQRKREGQMASTMQETLSSIKLVQGLAQEKYEADRFKKQNRRSLRAGLRASRLEAKLNVRVELAMAVSIAAILAFGTSKVLSNVLTPGDLLVFISYVRSFYRPLRRLSRTTKRGAAAAVCGERVLGILENIPDVRDLPGSVEAPRFSGEIIFDSVSFGYVENSMLLKNINLHISPGERLAIVGPTGVGKSTLVSLVPRFYDPNNGRVIVEGRDIREYKLASLRKQITLVLQEPMLFGTTIRENIAYTDPDAPIEQIIEAAKRANIHDFIVSLPEGYDTILGERGATVSGGQRQCLSIARALLRWTPIVILDEPTVGLDALSESLVLKALSNLMEGRTVLMIAHQFRTVQDADRIIVLENGQIVEEGNHSQLMECSSRYKQLYQVQVHSSLTAHEM